VALVARTGAQVCGSYSGAGAVGDVP